MGAIFNRVFTSGAGQYLTLAGEEFVRPLGFGSNWSAVRIAILCGVTPNGTSNITGVTCSIGLCSGSVGTLASGFVTNALAYTVNCTLNYTEGPPVRYALDTNPFFTKYVNNVSAQFGSAIASATLGLAGPNRTFITLAYTKGSPNFSTYMGETQVASYTVDHTCRHACEALDAALATATWSIDGTTSGTVVSSAQTAAFNESAGPLDTLDIYWPNGAFPLEIYGIYVMRIA